LLGEHLLDIGQTTQFLILKKLMSGVSENEGLMNGQPPLNLVLEELRTLDADFLPVFDERDAASRLITLLPTRYPLAQIAQPPGDRMWELAGLFFLYSGRIHEALEVFWGLYQQKLAAQVTLGRVHKGMPLCWIGECFSKLGFPVHAKRYLMLTLCEDALRESGIVSPNITGAYFRLIWEQGLPSEEFRRYARQLFELAEKMPGDAPFPEALLQRVDDAWLTELPSAAEALSYRANGTYVRHLLTRLGDGTGEALELLSEYLMSCMPGCRTRRRERSGSTDYDIVCAMEGVEVDFRSELGRYFVCECKDWASPASFTVMAKFCRVLDSIKSRFRILFSKSGSSGVGDTQFVEREQLKGFQDRGVVIVVLSLADLQEVASGANLIAMLRSRYEKVRLDLRAEHRLG
jgi:hypothetical protein